MTYSRLRTLSEVRTKDLYNYIKGGFYACYNNDDFWMNDNQKRHNIVISNIEDIAEKLIAIDKSPYIMGVIIYETPEDMSLFYKLLCNRKIKVSCSLLLDDKLDISKINVDHVCSEYSSFDFDERLLKYKEFMICKIYSIEDIPKAQRANELKIPIEIIHGADEEEGLSIEYYMDIITRLFEIGIRVSDDNVLSIIMTLGYADTKMIISLFDMSYQLLVTDLTVDFMPLTLDVRDTNTYNRVSRFMDVKSKLFYCLYTGDRIPDDIEIGPIYNLDLNDDHLIEEYLKRQDIMDITNPRYCISDDHHYSSGTLYKIYEKDKITSINHWIILLNDHNITMGEKNRRSMSFQVEPLDIITYRLGIARLWKQVYAIPKAVRYYLTNYRGLLTFLEPRIVKTKFYSYDGYAHIERNILLSDVNIRMISD